MNNNPAWMAFPDRQNISYIFEAQVRCTPEAIALVYEQDQLTYEELNRRANQLAWFLREQGVGPEVLVGIYLRRSPELIVSVLAILKAGGAYLPLDTASPTDRLADMLAEAQVQCVLTHTLLCASLPQVDATVLCLDTLELQIFHQPITGVVSHMATTNLAYVMYTSGSTGRPKGIAITHQNIVHLAYQPGYVQVHAHDTFLHLAPIAFDASTFEIWGCLLNGARLVLAPVDLPSLAEIVQTIHQQQISVLWLTAGLFHQMVEMQLEGLRPVKQLLAGGEALSVPHVRQVLSGLPTCQLINGYGPTECTTFSCCYALQPEDILDPSVPIGRPIPHAQAYVLDEQFQPVASGEVGELYIGGEGLARGYLNQPVLTATSFVPHPFSRVHGARLYRTGDLVQAQEDGTLLFLGRKDRQVKLRGYRIELGEIENWLVQYPVVRSAVVSMCEGRSGDKRLVAYLVSQEGNEEEEQKAVSSIRRYLQARLPEYMVPSFYIWLGALPLTPNGKVDRRALPLPQWGQADLLQDGSGWQTPLEEVIATIWSHVLEVPQIGPQAHFFDLGGHSLLATQVVARLREALQVDMSMRSLFDTPILAHFAAQVGRQRQEQRATWQGPLRPRLQQTTLPLSFAQERLWFLDQLTFHSGDERRSSNLSSTVSRAWHLEGLLRVSALEQSLTLLAERHEALRTHFMDVDGQPLQVITLPEPVLLPVIDLTSLCPNERERQVQHLLETQARIPFDIAQGPLWHAYVLRLEEHVHVLLLTLHHIITDGWSMSILFRELAASYQAMLTGHAPSLATLPIQYADYALWQREWLQGEHLIHELAYWRQQVAGAPTLLTWPRVRPRSTEQVFQRASYHFVLPTTLSHALEDVSRRASVTLFMTLLAVFAVLLGRYSGQDDILIGTPIANRTRKELEAIVGFFVNTLVLRVQLVENASFHQFLQQVRAVALDAYEHQDIPFERLVEELQPERSASHMPLCQVLFAFQNTPVESLELAGLHLQEKAVESEYVQFDLVLEMKQSKGTIEGIIHYNRALFETEVIVRLAEHYQLLATEVVAQPHKSIAYVPLLTEGECRQLEAWNTTQRDYPQKLCVHEAIEAQAVSRSEAVALVYEDTHITYGEFNRRANQLAHALRQRGVGVESLVGVCLEPSIALVVSLLGILKAGGAYVPLDPSYPQERLTFMLQNAHLHLLITTHACSQKIGWSESQQMGLIFVESKQEQESFAQQPADNPTSEVVCDHLAYVIYTSGSTGRPKGVQVTHRGLRNLVCWHQEAFALTPQDRTSQLASWSFDAAGWELWPTLAVGATVCLVEDEARHEVSRLCHVLNEQQITQSFLPTPLAESFLAGQWPAQLALRTLLTGGDALHRAPTQELPFILVNNYGPTENTVVATSGIVASLGEKSDAGAPSLGRPIANTCTYVLDQYMQRVPIGVTGELYIESEGLARGYLHRPDLTAERFLPSPFGGQLGLRLYKTGDLVRYRANGDLDFLGRNDGQVKIRGFRIERGEIEAVLWQHASIKEAVVLVREDRPEEKRLVAYIVVEPEFPVSLSQLRQYLQTKLPSYMLPSSIVTLEQLPLLPNGKLDYKKLPVPEMFHSDGEETYVPPSNAVEEVLANIWMEVLGGKRIGITDHFFERGGHSLLATQVISRMREAFQVSLPLSLLFEQPRLVDLARCVIQLQGATRPVIPQNVSQITSEDDVEHLLAKVDQLSPEEVDALLSAMLSEQKEKI